MLHAAAGSWESGARLLNNPGIQPWLPCKDVGKATPPVSQDAARRSHRLLTQVQGSKSTAASRSKSSES